MSANAYDEIDFTCNQLPRKLEYSKTLETQKNRNLDHKKSFFEAKIVSNENLDASDSLILATSGDDIHFIFTMPKESFFELDSKSFQRESIQLRNRSLIFSTDSVINKNSDFSQYETECFDTLKEVKYLDKIINNLDKDNSREIIASYNEDYKNQLECHDKLKRTIEEKKSDSNSMNAKNCMEEDIEDNRNNFIAVEEHYRNTPKNIREDKISPVNVSSKIDNSEIYEREETEFLSKIEGAEISHNLKFNKIRSIGDEFLEASTFKHKYAGECVKNYDLESSLYQQVESDRFNFKRLEDSLSIDETSSVKIISELSNGNIRLLNTDTSTEMQISNAFVKHADKMLVRNSQPNCSSLDYDSSSITPSTSKIFLISSGVPTFYSMKSIDSQVKSLNGTENDLEESLEYDFPNQAAVKSSTKYYLNDSDKNSRSSVLRKGDGFALQEPDGDDAGNKFSTHTPEDTFRKQHINNMEMISNEDISLISSADQKQAEQKSSPTVFIENKDIYKAKTTTYEKNKIESSKNIWDEEKLSFYILTPLGREKGNSLTGCSEILAKRLVEEDIPHRNLRSNAVQRIFEKKDKESKLCEMFFTKSTNVDIVDKMEKGSHEKTSTLLNDIESDDSDFEEYKTNENKFLKNEDETDCAPTRVRRLEPQIPFIESEESEPIFSKNDKFSNSVIVSSSKSFNRIPILRRSFRSRSLESISFPLSKTPDKLTPGCKETDSAEKKKKRLSFSGIMNKKDIKSAVVNSTWEITKAIISPESSAISKKRANSEVICSSQTLSRSKLRASMDFVKKHTKRASKVKK